MISIITKPNKNYLFPDFKIFFLIILCFFLQTGIMFADNSNQDNLCENLSTISYLQDLIQEHIDLYTINKTKLINKEKIINQEIIDKKKRLNINKISASQQNKFLQLDLKLIKQLKAYISQLTTKITLLENYNSKLSFLYDQTGDALILIENINNIYINKMITSINITLHKEILLIEKLLEEKPKKLWFTFL